jgi:Flp pilus assembly pilin Flp
VCETIRAKVELPCSVSLNGSRLRVARGVTEELTRESVVVVLSSTAGNRWLKASAKVSIAVELPFTGVFEPRILECAATVQRVRTFNSGVRLVAVVERMAIVSRDREMRAGSRSVTHTCAAASGSAVARSQNDNPVIRTNHRTNLNSNLTGEPTMSFLKNFFIEEDGQDMVEYGLVISLVVIGGVITYKTFSNTINNGINTVGNAITNAL